MESRFQLVTPAEARATMAAHVLPSDAGAQLGEIVLAAHQVAAARRLLALLAAHGGALLADDVGLGKTYVALAVARRYPAVLVIAPASLRGMWLAAIARAGVVARVVSYEALSAGPAPPGLWRAPPAPGSGTGHAIVILDEAHHARTPSSRRYPRIAELTGSAHALLLTATPLPNRVGDLRALVALFAGSRAATMSEAELTAVVYRRTAASVPSLTLPGVAAPRWIDIPDDAACLEALEQLPPAVPPAGSGAAGALALIGLVRQWASSHAALVAALRRSLARSHALRDAVAAGHLPTARELGTWCFGDDTMQLAFPELVAAPFDASVDRTGLDRALRAHGDAVSRLLVVLAHRPDPDVERARRIARVQAAHPGEKVVCFTGYAETAAAYWRYLRMRPGVARLTARGGHIASGPVSRDAVLQRFAPQGHRAVKPDGIEDVTMLITTDLLAEGVDLRDATVVVHLDLPWSPARMEQRVGRARRMGSSARTISVYAMRPPAPGESVLALERRLRRKIAVAARAVGIGASVLPVEHASREAPTASDDASTMDVPSISDAEMRSSVMDVVAQWSQAANAIPFVNDRPVAAAVAAPVDGWLAALTVGAERVLVASLDGVVGDDATTLARACAIAEGGATADAASHPAPAEHRLLEEAAAAALRHAAGRAAVALLPAVASRREGPCGRGATMRHQVLARIHRSLAAATPRDAPRVAHLAATARHVVNGRLSAGNESALRAIAQATFDDDGAWLRAVAAIADPPCDEPDGFRLHALIVFAPTSTGRAAATRS